MRFVVDNYYMLTVLIPCVTYIFITAFSFLNEGHSVTVDIGGILAEWMGETFKETTPDFLVTTNAQPCRPGTGGGQNQNLEEGSRGRGGRGEEGGGRRGGGGGGVCFVDIKNAELRSFVIKLVRK